MTCLLASASADPFGDVRGQALLARARGRGHRADDTHDLFPAARDAVAATTSDADAASAEGVRQCP